MRFRYLSQPEAFAAALNRSRETGYRYGVRKSGHDNATARVWGLWVVYRLSADVEVTSFTDIALGRRVFMRPDGTRREVAAVGGRW